MSSQVHNQAMEPVGHPTTPATYGRNRTASGGFTLGGFLSGTVGVLAFVAVILVAAVVLAAHVAAIQWLLGPQWGHAIGTIVANILIFVMVLATLLTMAERKWSALMQNRVGPNRARLPIPGLKDKPLLGLPHIAADVLKMLTKEEIIPAMSSKGLYLLAPALAFGPAFVLYAVVPMSPTFPFLGQNITMQVAQIDMGLLYVFAIASISVLGATLAGWASNNKYALLGGVRASAMMISYEVTLGLTLCGLMIVFQTLRLDEMTTAQSQYIWGWLPAWGVLFQPLAIIGYFAAASAEIKRAPFDLPEGESEIVGYFVEYSGLKFGTFMIAEFVEVVVFAGIFSALFFGGYHLPWGEGWILETFGATVLGILQLATFIAKTVIFCWLSLTVRWTFPRFRYDQVMDLGWKMLLPLSLANVVITAVVVLLWGLEGAAVFGLIQMALVVFFIVGALTVSRSGKETLLPAETVDAGHDGHGHGPAVEHA